MTATKTTLQTMADDRKLISKHMQRGICMNAFYDGRPFNFPEKDLTMKNFSAIVAGAASAAALAALSVTAATPAFAATATTTIDVGATIVASCTISTTPVEFGNYSPTSTTAHYASGTVKIECVKGSVPTVALNGGQNQGATTIERSMKHTSGTDLLAYSLFKPSATVPNTACTNNETDAWGSDQTESFSPSGVTLSGSVYHVCGKIAAGHDVSAGRYTDIVTATVEF